MKKDISVRDRVRKEIRDLVPYDTHPYPNVLRMDLNENPYPFPQPVTEEILRDLNGDVFTRYPDPGAVELRQVLARYNGVQPENLIVGNGSDELIQLLYLTFGGRENTVLIPAPTFSMFKIHARISETNIVEFPMDEDYNVSVEGLLEEAARVNPDIIVLVTPNNPTGTVVPEEDILRVLTETGALVVVDEAYFEFNRETVAPYLKDHSNLIILRTFSKAFGLAGMRVGYLISSEEVITELNKIKQPFNVNSFSQLAAKAAVKYSELFTEQIKMIIAERDRLYEAVQAKPGLVVYPSQSNFILFKTPFASDKIYNKLLQSGILIRDLGKAPGLTDCLRVTVGKKEDNQLFLEKLAEALEDF